MNKLITITFSLLTLAFASMAHAGAYRIPPAQATSSSNASVVAESQIIEVKKPIDPDVMSYMESHRGNEVTKTLRHGQQMFLLEASEALTPSQIFKCFAALKLEDTKRGVILIRTAGQTGRIEILGIRSVLVNDSKPEEFRCD